MTARSAALAAVMIAAACGGAGGGCSRPAAAGSAPLAAAPAVVQCLRVATVRLDQPRQGMAFIPGGRTKLGSDQFYAEEGPVHYADVHGFWIDTHEVTNGEFAAFVHATGYVTLAERGHAGGAVFFMPTHVSDLTNIAQWWKLSPDATWRQPEGRGSSALTNFPVVQIAYADALAYAHWRGRDLPTEAEWERAARGSEPDAEYAWGKDAVPKGKPRANVWQGVFPIIDTATDGFHGRAPDGCYAPNAYGLYDMIGNVWEWVKDPWPVAPGQPPARVIKGGSFLCSEDYCRRFRPSALQPGETALGSSHLGFRTVLRDAGPTG